MSPQISHFPASCIEILSIFDSLFNIISVLDDGPANNERVKGFEEGLRVKFISGVFELDELLNSALKVGSEEKKELAGFLGMLISGDSFANS